MQSFSELSASLGCTECESSFNSASLLLKHFAEHISQDVLKNEGNNSSYAYDKEKELQKQPWKEEKNESILEKALRSPLATTTQVGKPSSFQLPSAITSLKKSSIEQSVSTVYRKPVFSSPKTLNNNTKLPNICAKVPGKNVSLETPKRSKSKCPAIGNVMFFKLDLQKRLENCVLKFVRRDNSLVEDSQSAFVDRVNAVDSDQSLQHSVVKASDCPVVPNGALASIKENDSNDIVESSEPQDDFNPLKFCVVTMEEGDEKLELNDEDENSESHSPPPSNEQINYGVVPEKARKPMKCRNDCTKAISKLKKCVVGGGNGMVKSESSRKKYPCTYCSKQFGWSTDLKRHILTHTGERPFGCTLCSATFTRNFLLQKHIGKVHASRIQAAKSTLNSSEESPGKEAIGHPEDTGRPPSLDTEEPLEKTSLPNGVEDGPEGVQEVGYSRAINITAETNGRVASGKSVEDYPTYNGQRERSEVNRSKRKVVQEDDEQQRRRRRKKKKKASGNGIRNPLGTLVRVSTNPLLTLECLSAKDPV